MQNPPFFSSGLGTGNSGDLITWEGESRKEATQPKFILSTKATLNLGTWKVRTMYTAGKTAKVEAEMRNYHLDIPALACQGGLVEDRSCWLQEKGYCVPAMRKITHLTQKELLSCFPKQLRKRSSHGKPTAHTSLQTHSKQAIKG